MKLYKDKNPDYSAYLSKTWGIPEETIVDYHGGICYDTVTLNSEEAANKVTEVVKKETVNGGWFHGMNPGGQTHLKDPEGNPLWQVMC